MARIKLKQNDYDRVKRAVENIVRAVNGDFSDVRGAKFIKSTYSRKGFESFRIDWHTSYSDVRALKHTKVQAVAHLASWGLDKKETRRQKGIAFVGNAIEELIIFDLYRILDKEFELLAEDTDD